MPQKNPRFLSFPIPFKTFYNKMLRRNQPIQMAAGRHWLQRNHCAPAKPLREQSLHEQDRHRKRAYSLLAISVFGYIGFVFDFEPRSLNFHGNAWDFVLYKAFPKV